MCFTDTERCQNYLLLSGLCIMTKLIFSRFFINLKCSEVNTSFAMIKSKVFPQLPSEQRKIRPRGKSSGRPLCESSTRENTRQLHWDSNSPSKRKVYRQSHMVKSSSPEPSHLQKQKSFHLVLKILIDFPNRVDLPTLTPTALTLHKELCRGESFCYFSEWF